MDIRFGPALRPAAWEEVMSASREWREWHLTPNGWVQGSVQTDFSDVKQMPTPADRVLTCRYLEELGAAGGKWHKGVSEEWRSKDETTVGTLLKQFGECPRKLF
ncbi:hypothetical protein HPC49_05560 [Pyxidicoccus fallax]|uniref:Uncharacterized protein n=1 Tax=Pyxidicoccus fallax TaxID=394095 RepID=A0A848LID7_9BACT|nr:hypothetical protein [Pyxidicoccus fallax]NMO17484.1 hypothetical protein [Pyxidicoccus fallax]NPC77721.1 hypothetical protein [Pyxidicoccus fallax]